MRRQRLVLACASFAAAFACKNPQQTTVKEDDAASPTDPAPADATATVDFSAIYGTFHGDPVDDNLAFLSNISEAQLLAYQGGSPGEKFSGGKDEALIAESGQGGTITNTADTGIALQGGTPTAYMRDCATAGVPLPPAWGSADWQLKGELPKDRIFASQAAYKTEFYMYTAANGVCAALPRSSGGSILFLGIICQGDNGKSCFWDNLDVTTKVRVSAAASLKAELLQDGTNLKENCTDCHRGDNAFVVHADTVLKDLPTSTDRYEPVAAQAGWANPKGSDTLAEKCQTCHEVPALTRLYCNTVLLQSVRGTTGTPTMPPRGKKAADFADAIRQLETACSRL